MTLKIKSRSPEHIQPFILSKCYAYTNMVNIHPNVLIDLNTFNLKLENATSEVSVTLKNL